MTDKPEMPLLLPTDYSYNHQADVPVTKKGDGTGHGEGFMSGPVGYWTYHRRKNRVWAMGYRA